MSFKIGDFVEVVGNFMQLDEHGHITGYGSLYGVINGFYPNYEFFDGPQPAYHIAYEHDPNVRGSWTKPRHLKHANVLDRLAALAPKGDHNGGKSTSHTG